MGKSYKREKINGFPREIYLDKQKDIKVIRRKKYAIVSNVFSSS